MRERLAVAMPIALLLAMVGVHSWLVTTHSLSPWLSAGFGMFSTYDGPGNRELTVTAEGDGTEWRVELRQGPGTSAYRYGALPGGDRLAQFVDRLVRQNHPDLQRARRLRVEVWQRVVSGRPLAPTVRLLQSHESDLSDRER